MALTHPGLMGPSFRLKSESVPLGETASIVKLNTVKVTIVHKKYTVILIIERSMDTRPQN